MQKLIITVGLPASGKSTYAKQYVLDNPDTVRVNRDDIRNMLGKYWMPRRETVVTIIEEQAIRGGLLHGFNVVVDATNLNPKYRTNIERIAEVFGATIEYVDFTGVDIKLCIQRDQQRENPVGKMVIERMYNQYLKEKE